MSKSTQNTKNTKNTKTTKTSEEDAVSRIEVLEKRVAELEEIIKNFIEERAISKSSGDSTSTSEKSEKSGKTTPKNKKETKSKTTPKNKKETEPVSTDLTNADIDKMTKAVLVEHLLNFGITQADVKKSTGLTAPPVAEFKAALKSAVRKEKAKAKKAEKEAPVKKTKVANKTKAKKNTLTAHPDKGYSIDSSDFLYPLEDDTKVVARLVNDNITILKLADTKELKEMGVEYEKMTAAAAKKLFISLIVEEEEAEDDVEGAEEEAEDEGDEVVEEGDEEPVEEGEGDEEAEEEKVVEKKTKKNAKKSAK